MEHCKHLVLGRKFVTPEPPSLYALAAVLAVVGLEPAQATILKLGSSWRTGERGGVEYNCHARV